MEGWVKLHRQVLENPVVCKDSDYFSVWCYLLLNATHKEQSKMFAGKRITLEKGQLITGRKVIANIFSIDESKVQRILKKLENEHQIEQRTSNANRLISIVNWCLYQEDEQPNEQRMNNGCTTDEQPTTSNEQRMNNGCTTDEHKQECKEGKNGDNGKECKEGKECNNVNKIHYQLFVDDYNSNCKSLPKVIKLTDKRRKAIKSSLNTFSESDIHQAFVMAEESDFLTNRNGKGFAAGFDWIMNTSNMTKILEGNYKNKQQKKVTFMDLVDDDGKQEENSDVIDVEGKEVFDSLW